MITEQEIEQYGETYLNGNRQFCMGKQEEALVKFGFTDGMRYAIEKIQYNWIPVQPLTPELINKLESTDARLIQCLFDTGEILAFNYDHPFAIMTHYCFLPQLPTNKP